MRKNVAIAGGIVIVIAAVLLFAYHSGNPNAGNGNNGASTNQPSPQLSYNENILLDRGVTSGKLPALKRLSANT
jgi:hypothetical protein